MSRQWLDQRRPLVTSVSAPFGQRGADEELEVAQLVATERERKEVLTLDPDLDVMSKCGREPGHHVERRWAIEQAEPGPRRGGDGHDRMVAAYHRPMATRITPADRLTSVGQHAGMERSIAISRPTVGADHLYTAIVSTAPGDRTRIHHHGDCETSIYILSGAARYTWGVTGLENEMTARSGDVIYIPAGEVHVEENASESEPLVVVLTRNCPDSHVVYLDDGPDGRDDVPAPC